MKKTIEYYPWFIKAVRKAMGKTRREFGDKLGVSDITIFRWESGLSRPRGPSLVAINKFMKSELVRNLNVSHPARGECVCGFEEESE